MLQEPMMEKLQAMRLHGMADALKTQEQDPGARELSFLERLALLVDHQWNWRQNQALARRLQAAKLRGNACVEQLLCLFNGDFGPFALVTDLVDVTGQPFRPSIYGQAESAGLDTGLLHVFGWGGGRCRLGRSPGSAGQHGAPQHVKRKVEPRLQFNSKVGRAI